MADMQCDSAKKEGGGHPLVSYRRNCSKTDLGTELPVVNKFKFVHYGFGSKICLNQLNKVYCNSKIKTKIRDSTKINYLVGFWTADLGMKAPEIHILRTK